MQVKPNMQPMFNMQSFLLEKVHVWLCGYIIHSAHILMQMLIKNKTSANLKQVLNNMQTNTTHAKTTPDMLK